MNHPLTHVPPGSLRYWQVPSVSVAAVFLGSLFFVAPFRESHTLVELVESGSVDAAAAILAHWSPEERVRAAYGVGFDYLMNPAYMNVVAIACVWASRQFGSARAANVGSWFAWLCWSVIATNAAENVGLFIALSSGPVAPWPIIVAGAHYWAGGVIGVSVAFVLAGVHRRWTERAR